MGGGKSGGGSSTAPSPYEQALSKMAIDSYNQTAGIRNYFLGGTGGGGAGTVSATPSNPNNLDYARILNDPYGYARSPGSFVLPSTDGAAGSAGSAAASEPGGMFGDVLSGRFDPSTSKLWAPSFSSGKQAIEDQYGIAKDAVLANAPRGGAMGSGLADVEISRAQDASSLPQQLSASITEDMMNKAYGAAFGAPASAMSGLSSAAGTYGSRQAQQDAINAQKQAAQARGMGSLIGMGIGTAIAPGIGTKAGATVGAEAGGAGGK